MFPHPLQMKTTFTDFMIRLMEVEVFRD